MPNEPGKEVVVVTGGSAGVGRATVREFAKNGANVGIIARGEAGLAGAKADVEAAGQEAYVVQADVADADAVQSAADEIADHFGRIDVWVNNAMTSVFGRFESIKPEEFKRVVEVNLLGFVHGTQAALSHMRDCSHGSIVQVGSALAFRGIPLQSAYCATKHAVEGLTDSLRAELLHDDDTHIDLSIVHLPAMNTPQFGWVRNHMDYNSQPVPPIYQPEVAARAIYKAAHTKKREIWVGSSTAQVIVGNRLSPDAGDHYLARTGFSSQQTDEPHNPNSPDNLWHPLDDTRDFGARGKFSDKAKDRSLYSQTVFHRRLLYAAGSVLTVVLMWLGLKEAREE
jgi:short-subunit dehydrogenase